MLCFIKPHNIFVNDAEIFPTGSKRQGRLMLGSMVWDADTSSGSN